MVSFVGQNDQQNGQPIIGPTNDSIVQNNSNPSTNVSTPQTYIDAFKYEIPFVNTASLMNPAGDFIFVRSASPNPIPPTTTCTIQTTNLRPYNQLFRLAWVRHLQPVLDFIGVNEKVTENNGRGKDGKKGDNGKDEKDTANQQDENGVKNPSTTDNNVNDDNTTETDKKSDIGGKETPNPSEPTTSTTSSSPTPPNTIPHFNQYPHRFPKQTLKSYQKRCINYF